MNKLKDLNYRKFLIKETDYFLPALIVAVLYIMITLFSTLALFWTTSFWYIPVTMFVIALVSKLNKSNKLYNMYMNSPYYNPDYSKIEIPDEEEDAVDDYMEYHFPAAYNTTLICALLILICIIAGVILFFFVKWWWIFGCIALTAGILFELTENYYKTTFYKDFLQSKTN